MDGRIDVVEHGGLDHSAIVRPAASQRKPFMTVVIHIGISPRGTSE